MPNSWCQKHNYRSEGTSVNTGKKKKRDEKYKTIQNKCCKYMNRNLDLMKARRKQRYHDFHSGISHTHREDHHMQ